MAHLLADPERTEKISEAFRKDKLATAFEGKELALLLYARKLTLNPGEMKTVRFEIGAEMLYYFNEGQNQFEVEPGIFTASVGGSSDNLPLSGNFTIQNSVL